MYHLFPLKLFLTVIAILLVVIGAIQIAITGAEITLVLVFSTAMSAAGILSTLLILLGSNVSWKYLWSKLWRKFPKLETLLFPDLNGTWKGITLSNWPLKEPILVANGNPVSPATNLVEGKFLSTPVTVQIKQSWLGIKVILGSDSGYSNSKTLYAHPVKNEEDFILIYQYINLTPGYKTTDQNSHMGAAELKFSRDAAGMAYLKGDYWTNRAWRNGLNTAGSLELTQLS